MTIFSIVSFLIGAVLGQHFKVMVLIPAAAIVLAFTVGLGITHAYTVWSVVLMGAVAVSSMQIGYLVGISIHHALAAVSSSRSSALTSARRSAH